MIKNDKNWQCHHEKKWKKIIKVITKSYAIILSERVSSVSEWANGQANGPVLASWFLANLIQCIGVVVFSARQKIRRKELGGAVLANTRLEDDCKSDDQAGLETSFWLLLLTSASLLLLVGSLGRYVDGRRDVCDISFEN